MNIMTNTAIEANRVGGTAADVAPTGAASEGKVVGGLV